MTLRQAFLIIVLPFGDRIKLIDAPLGCCVPYPRIMGYAMNSDHSNVQSTEYG